MSAGEIPDKIIKQMGDFLDGIAQSVTQSGADIFPAGEHFVVDDLEWANPAVEFEDYVQIVESAPHPWLRGLLPATVE